MNKKVIRRRIKFIIEPIFNYFKKANHRRNVQYTRCYEKLDVVDHTILYESRDGKSVTDSPYAIFKYLLNNPDYKNFTHIWSVSNFEELNSVISQYSGMDNVKFVKRNSKEYLKYLATSKYLINNSTFQSFFIPKSEQVYINTWHGTPLKSMGFDIPGNPAHSQNVVRNFLSADYLLSPNEHTTNMFVESYKLKGIYSGEIIEEGYPRIDLTLNTDPESFKTYLGGLGLELDQNKQTILYAPTWKGTNVSRAKNDMYQIIADMTYLKNQVGEKYNLLIKVHPFLYQQAKMFDDIKNILIPDFIDTNELLNIVDILMTDYSSIFFDFLVTNKPILFYVWDYDDYNEERGRYLSDDELPGPTLFTIEEVSSAIQNITKVNMEFKDVYNQAKVRFTGHEDGSVTKRIADYIFGKSISSLNILNNFDTRKQRILIYPGGMMNNGITSSFINLMDNIDFNRYDVSIFMKTPDSKEALNNISKVNKNARFLFRHGLAVYSLFEVYRDKFVHNRGAYTAFMKMLYPKNAYKREFKRYFGRSNFDLAIDFSGYSLFWAKYLLISDAKKKICYMHNDLLSDCERTINGRRPHRINLRGLFSVYHQFDKLVSVSLGTMELNKKNLIEFADESKFDYVMNSINPEKILRLSNDENNETQEVLEGEEVPKNASFKSRAIINNPGEHFVWNRPEVLSDARRVSPAKDYLNKEVVIIRELNRETNIYYKFTIEDRIIGWLDQECFELLPDSILFQRPVNKVAILKNVRGNGIWTHPYSVEGIKKVSSSYDFKNLYVEVDLEAKTQHGLYNQFSINGILIGWIDSSALSVIKEFDYTNMSNSKREKDYYRRLNYNRHQEIITHLEDRTLEEEYINKQAIISNPEKYVVWSKPYPNAGCKQVMDASEWSVCEVYVIKNNRTDKGTFYQFSSKGKTIGWLDMNAFTFIEEPIIEVETTQAEGIQTANGLIPEPSKRDYNFINMGRLSPEKAQDNLIKAFGHFHRGFKNSKLYILGEGPLRNDLQALITELNLEESVYLVGQLDNPFKLLKKCDCFVLSSHYEGQPMVLLEAMTLGMKIIATDIVANRTVLEQGRFGLLVENSIEGLENGLKQMAKNELDYRPDEFNPDEYNKKAMDTFYKVLK
ncbi:GW domain-containing glycosaminoglycan-binding protein [Bacillus salipaludis]|uniref:GW domain-containing glycosaminoglycan-binding protein n=1 Tax=Bacillus salipaludis TaxID=2547811 RepID=A0A4R5VT79_9BACI|nr:CDP-glycerol glycerophosphotransferase family protein [Bacillus salipaludis]TDK62187.1 GW domain-containing glycosaminoglycan-binding protein [Bacillus salipaludis]